MTALKEEEIYSSFCIGRFFLLYVFTFTKIVILLQNSKNQELRTKNLVHKKDLKNNWRIIIRQCDDSSLPLFKFIINRMPTTNWGEKSSRRKQTIKISAAKTNRTPFLLISISRVKTLNCSSVFFPYALSSYNMTVNLAE